jgi:hypothetical protein
LIKKKKKFFRLTEGRTLNIGRTQEQGARTQSPRAVARTAK